MQDKDGQAQVALLQECLKDALGGFAPAYQAPSDIDLVESAFSERLKHLKEQCELESGGPDPGLSALLFACELVSPYTRKSTLSNETGKANREASDS